ncbi:MAG: phosphopyruvate hydratase [Betaproteobacteria bacterium]|jgi:enolase|nr:phosphopyruvate hydratase [Betaproteobacteria bacterium]
MTDATITRVHGRRIWDSRGRPTVEVEVHTAGGAVGHAAAPAGASRGSREAVDLRDGGQRFGGMDVQRALANVNGPIAHALVGLDARRQESIDRTLLDADGTTNKSKLGGNAIVATSLACADAAAAAEHVPLWRYLAGDAPVRLPLPEIQIFGGGAHAGRRMDIQDLMIMALSARSFAEALEMTAEVYRAAGELIKESGKLAGVADEGGYWPQFESNEAALEALVRAIERAGFVPGDEVAISLDIAASEFGGNGRYRLALDGRGLDRDAMIELVIGWLDRFPIASIEDPVAEDDPDAMTRLTQAVGHRVQVIGDDFLVTSAARVGEALRRGACNAVLIKPNQAGTLTEARAALEAGRRAGWGTIVSARSGETEDASIAHLAVGWDAGQLKVGSFARSERMAKWNEALRIEERLGSQARYAGREALPQFGTPRATP